MIERYQDRAAGVAAGRAPTRTRSDDRPMMDLVTDHAAGLRTACEILTSNLRWYVRERTGQYAD